MSLWDDFEGNGLQVNQTIQAESRGNPRAISPKGAIGLMQIEPETARMLGYSPEDMLDPTKNKAAGTKYLSMLRDRYNGNMHLAHAAYNWGPGHIDRVGYNPDRWPAETRKYVEEIMGPLPPARLQQASMWDQFEQKGRGGAAPPTETAPPSAPEMVEPLPPAPPSPPTSGYSMNELVPEPIPSVPAGAQAGETIGRTGAQIGGEYLGAAGGEALGIGPIAGGALGAGIAGTSADALAALLNHAKYGTPLNVGMRSTLEDFAINSGSSLLSSAIGKILGGAVKPEAETVREAAATGMQAKGRFQEGNAAIEQGMEDASRAKQEAELKKVTPEARQEQITQVTGQTPEKASLAAVPTTGLTKAGVVGPSAETLAKRRDIHGTYFDTEKKLGEAYGKQYQNLRGPYGNNTTPTNKIWDEMNKWDNHYLGRGETAPPAVKEIIKNGRALMRHTFLDMPEAAVYGEIPGFAKRTLTLEGKMAQAEGLIPYAPEIGKSNFNKVLAFQQEVEQFARETHDDTAAHFASEVGKAARESLEETEGMPASVHREIKDLNRQYQNYKQVFNRGDARFIQGEPDPIAVAGRIFNQPELTERIANNASPEGREAMRESLGNWIQHNPSALATTNPTEAMNRAYSIGALYPGSPLADPKAITYIGATMENIATAPQANAAFQATMDQTAKDAVHEGSIKVRQLALSEAKHLGPADQPFVKQLTQAKTPEEAAQIAIQHFTGMTPESLVQSIAKGQKLFGKSVAGKIVRGDEGGMWLKRIWHDPETLKYIAGIAAAQMALRGTMSWYGDMAVAGSIPVIRRVIANGFVQGLKDPEVAKELIAGTTPALKMMFGPWTKAIMKGATNEAAAAIAKLVTNDPLATPDPRETAPLPSLKPAWDGAKQNKDDATTKKIRDIVIKRLKTGEWKGLDPNVQRQLGPWFREMLLSA